MRRFVLFFSLALLILVGCQAVRSIPPAYTQADERISAELTVRNATTSTPPFVWWEAEQPTKTNFPSSHAFAPANSTEAAVLSGNQWIGVEGKRSTPLFLEYTVKVPSTGSYFFYSRKFWQHGPFRWRWDDQAWQAAGRTLFLMDNASLRQFVGVNWVSLGTVPLSAGTHTLRIELTETDGAAAFDCFVLTQAPFQPRGRLKPNQRYAADLPGWFLYDPDADPFVKSAIDLRFLNESVAGEQGFIQVKEGAFVHEKTGEPVRFWAVNTLLQTIEMDPASLKATARYLAKRGVNMVRLHGNLWTASPDLHTIDPAELNKVFAFVNALKQEGIYTCLSIYFPFWFSFGSDQGFAGYNDQHPFSLLFFNQEFQQRYYDWWRTLLTTPNPATGKSLRDDPAVAMVELVNEDSYLFWTFQPYQSIPAPQMEKLEQQFGQWLTAKYGTIDQALKTWKTGARSSPPANPDHPEQGRVAILPPGEIVTQRASQRAQDTAAFLTQSQKQFFQDAIALLRQQLHYKGLIYASNWITADARVLGPLDKYSNTVADFMDRHGYFSGPHEGDRAAFSLNPGDTYQDRSALLFTSFDKGQEHDFSLPIMDLHYNGLPSTTTEVNWTMPNRFRAEFPLLAAAYGALQGSDGLFFFMTGNPQWEQSLDKFAIASPALMGQFPATALIYRKGLVDAGDRVVDVSLKLDDLYALKGAPLTSPQNLDALRAKDVRPGQVIQGEGIDSIDPLAFLVGQVNFSFSPTEARSRVVELSRFIDRQAKTVRSSTGQLLWDYRNGLVTVNAPKAQGATGFLKQAGSLELNDVSLKSDLEYGTLLLVALDDQPLNQSRRMLLQVMSEERNFGWQTTGETRKTIDRVGNAPIIVRNLTGEITLKRSDAAALTITALDANGYARSPVNSTINHGARFNLLPDTLYYLIEPS